MAFISARAESGSRPRMTRMILPARAHEPSHCFLLLAGRDVIPELLLRCDGVGVDRWRSGRVRRSATC